MLLRLPGAQNTLRPIVSRQFSLTAHNTHRAARAGISTSAKLALPEGTLGLGHVAPRHAQSAAPIIQRRTQQLVSHFFTSASTSPSSSTTDSMASLPISEKGYQSNAPSVYTARKVAPANTLEHRVYIEKDGVPVSPCKSIRHVKLAMLKVLTPASPRYSVVRQPATDRVEHGR